MAKKDQSFTYEQKQIILNEYIRPLLKDGETQKMRDEALAARKIEFRRANARKTL